MCFMSLKQNKTIAEAQCSICYPLHIHCVKTESLSHILWYKLSVILYSKIPRRDSSPMRILRVNESTYTKHLQNETLHRNPTSASSSSLFLLIFHSVWYVGPKLLYHDLLKPRQRCPLQKHHMLRDTCHSGSSRKYLKLCCEDADLGKLAKSLLWCEVKWVTVKGHCTDFIRLVCYIRAAVEGWIERSRKQTDHFKSLILYIWVSQPVSNVSSGTRSTAAGQGSSPQVKYLSITSVSK